MSAPRTIVVGDVHGCLDELDELLRVVARVGQDRLVFLGDLLDRGPDPVGTLRRVRELGAECVLGNHEEAHLRYARHERKARAKPGYQNPMRPFVGARLEQHQALSEDDLAWLAALPTTLSVAQDWTAVHAGLEPARPIDEQKPALLLRLRYIDREGRFVGSDDPTRVPPGARPWATGWHGPGNVVYGHEVHDLREPRVDVDPVSGVECWGIDTGCCFGGHLTALVLPEREAVQVPARRAYAQLRGRGVE